MNRGLISVLHRGFGFIKNLDYRLQASYSRGKLASCGTPFTMGRRVRLEDGAQIRFGDNVSISDDCWILAQGGEAAITFGSHITLNRNVFMVATHSQSITIGDYVMIGPNVVLRAGNHGFEDSHIPMMRQKHVDGSIVVGSDVWLGANVVITSNVTIGDHAIVGAGAVVTKDVAPWSIVGGVPAREIAQRPQQPESGE